MFLDNKSLLNLSKIVMFINKLLNESYLEFINKFTWLEHISKISWQWKYIISLPAIYIYKYIYIYKGVNINIDR